MDSDNIPQEQSAETVGDPDSRSALECRSIGHDRARPRRFPLDTRRRGNRRTHPCRRCPHVVSHQRSTSGIHTLVPRLLALRQISD